MPYKEIYLECTSNGSNKFYLMTPSADQSEFTASYGKIGSIGQTTKYSISQWYKKLNEKLRKGYVEKPNPQATDGQTTYSPKQIIEDANRAATKYLILNGKDDLTCPFETTDKKGSYHIFYRIMSKRDINLPSGLVIRSGTIGGLIESPLCLSQSGECWVDENAIAEVDSRITGNAYVTENARVAGHATVTGNAVVRGTAIVEGKASITDYAQIYDSAKIKGASKVEGRAMVGGNTVFDGNCRVCGDAWYELDRTYTQGTFTDTVIPN